MEGRQKVAHGGRNKTFPNFSLQSSVKGALMNTNFEVLSHIFDLVQL